MRDILQDLLEEKISIENAEKLLRVNDILELDQIAKLDIGRENRTGFPEAILAQGKDHDDLLIIINGYCTKKNSNNLLITRLDKNDYNRLKKDLKHLEEKGYNLDYNNKAKILIISNESKNKLSTNYGKIGIITGGTSDIPIAEEAKVIAEQGGAEVLTSYDVGVAGINRLFPQLAKMVKEGVKTIIVCAGMEGALTSVVAGLVDVPVIGVPTSVGYGIGGKGKAALYGMLQSCAPGIAVVNIDNGFGAAVFALTIIKNNK
ncbi:N5-carboxyaminoimidazole ribonucleotide mutase [Methanobrevibacter cuticularis]|uniref:N5-carboxyaminoimidazole ribonucleotide mutase n=1 Tax=Methanobrevibacter cuticularis TaxID=47311 RepID=A0A166EJ03_9EURY|nr:nickel pincer cofactor biosynthesis protein LarB [Methanobrevibacter cuticularis]KZX16708.1 N5-carboxyaminoimidazole ribonucleotide mutase [Methanobrevibacter cuticularis]